MPVPLTVVIPTLNEASQIAECVRGLTWADEVLVADGGSIDGTAERARTAGARVLSGDWATIAAQRNAAAPAHDAYAARRRNVYLGRTITHAGWGSDWVVRVFRRTSRFVERRVHEALERQRDVGRLRAPLEHVPYRDLAHHLEKLERYAEWAARDLADRGRRARVTDLVLRPPARFVRMYVLQLGLLDGWRGALLCGFAALSVFLKYARLYELRQRVDA